jgi:DNA (cytosine-5)-methyltransferase 1
MRYLSVCSGIEAATVAWHPLGWTPVAFSEIEKFPSAVLAHHYPDTPNLGDMTQHEHWPIGPGSVDLLVGGTPCQSFSVAGLRKGLADPRGNLALTYLAIADRLRPRWLVWENVPGVLSSSGGRDFGSFLGALAELWYGFAYRVLDAQYHGVAQRRRRVFLVGHLGDWRRAAAVLFERICNELSPTSEAARTTANRSAVCLTANYRKGVHSGGETYIRKAGKLRRLTPVECERLQGFPDGYTAIPWRGKPAAECPDGPRYRALGNSMAVPCMRWIGERIAQVDALDGR